MPPVSVQKEKQMEPFIPTNTPLFFSLHCRESGYTIIYLWMATFFSKLFFRLAIFQNSRSINPIQLFKSDGIDRNFYFFFQETFVLPSVWVEIVELTRIYSFRD